MEPWSGTRNRETEREAAQCGITERESFAGRGEEERFYVKHSLVITRDDEDASQMRRKICAESR